MFLNSYSIFLRFVLNLCTSSSFSLLEDALLIYSFNSLPLFLFSTSSFSISFFRSYNCFYNSSIYFFRPIISLSLFDKIKVTSDTSFFKFSISFSFFCNYSLFFYTSALLSCDLSKFSSSREFSLIIFSFFSLISFSEFSFNSYSCLLNMFFSF